MKLSNASALITAAKFAKCRVRLSKRAKNNAEPKTNRIRRHAGAGVLNGFEKSN